MVRSRFPGKPAKYFQRRKVSTSVINDEDYDGFRASQDAYFRLSTFNLLFPDDDEDSSFHGFSPHETKVECSQENSEKPASKIKKSKHLNKTKNLQNNGICEKSKAKKESPTQVKQSIKNNDSKKVGKISKYKDSSITRTDKKDDSGIISTGFVLPSRSVHSSRVIKPNKRFLDNDNTNVSNKKQCLQNKKIEVKSIEKNESECEKDQESPGAKEEIKAKSERITADVDISSAKEDSQISESDDDKKSSLAKCILRKPRLNIKSQPFRIVEGPFSSPASESVCPASYNHSVATKVVCGVCGNMCLCKFFRQARKFGIFSCDPCRRFILNILKKEKNQELDQLACISRTGNCPIRYSSLINQPFISNPDQHKDNERCEGCWLNLCLKSFKLPPGLTKRLSSYLPFEIIPKPVGLSLEKIPLKTKWSDVETVTEDLHENISENNDTLKQKRKLGKITNIKLFKEPDNLKKSKSSQKISTAGPRVKHVCRSASVVLGQPTAKFIPGMQKCTTTNQMSIDNVTEEKCQPKSKDQTEESLIIPVTDDGDKKVEEQVKLLQNHSLETEEIPERPIARMLQDLGKHNCDLLDGFEKHESEKRFARVSIDFWESYDPDEVSQMGFPLLAYSQLKTKALCFLCGSAGFEKLIHCASCCEPYHTFCVANLRFAKKEKEWWKLDWLCPRCCCCEICSKMGGTQLTCAKCYKSYHSNCIPSGRTSISDISWICPSCLYCKSCNIDAVYVFVGNMPLCKVCFKLRKKGNFCPLCQRCYDDNDYSTKMMECAECKCWIHAKCEGLSNEKYQVLSYLPSSIEFVCRLCCKNPPPLWLEAVNANLKAGYLSVIKSLSKNRLLCSLVKSSPKKRVCDCQDNNKKPIHLRNLSSQNESNSLSNEKVYMTGNESPFLTVDDKNSDLGLLTPKLTKDDEESLKTVKSGFLNLVTQKTAFDIKEISGNFKENSSKFIKTENKNPNLLSIVCNNDEEIVRIKGISYGNADNSVSDKSVDSTNSLLAEKIDLPEKKCSCFCSLDNFSNQNLSLMGIKNKATNDEYISVIEFNKDMEMVIQEIGKAELTKFYQKSLKQIFPWFSPGDFDKCDASVQEVDLLSSNTVNKENKKNINHEFEEQKTLKLNDSLKGLLTQEQDYYYCSLNIQDTRICMLCKAVGEGLPSKEGRLLYCGQNEWVHANCALWSSEVFEEIDGSLQNVHSAISRARLIRCFGCDKKGASVGCCARSCPFAYHFSCALLADCVFLENMEVYCKNHSSMGGNKGRHEDFCISRSVYVELDHKKKKDVLHHEVKLYIGSLTINSIGEILPEISDLADIILPCDYKCSRLYWSIKEPWKLVQYHIRTKLTQSVDEFCVENDTNYTLDHSLEFTPPPSPVESNQLKNYNPKTEEKEVRSVIAFLLDAVCSKEEDNNLSEQQTTDLLPPELKEAIFEDLPHDLLDGISMHDIFTKMGYDDISESKFDKTESLGESGFTGISLKKTQGERFKDELDKTNIFKYVTKPLKKIRQLKKQSSCLKSIRLPSKKDLDKVREQENYLERGKKNNWKSQKLLQVDGAIDFSESESNDSCDTNIQAENINRISNENASEDKPVKCLRCRRTYRSNVGYERHLTSCTYDFQFSSENDSSEEEKTSDGGNSFIPNKINFQESITTNFNLEQPEHENSSFSENMANQEAHFSVLKGADNQSVPLQVSLCSNTTNMLNSPSNFHKIDPDENITFSTHKPVTVLNKSQETSYVYPGVLETPKQSVLEIQNSVTSTAPAIILQQMPTENVMPTYLAPFQQQSQQEVQYITVEPQEKPYLASTPLTSGTFHIQQAPMARPVVQSVPTVVGTLIQTNGVDGIMLNNTNPSLEMYNPQQNNVFITNPSVIVGMETVVSNTVMSSSQFISGSMPGVLAASSYSATTTQVFQTKPVLDVPQGYVVVNANPPVVNNSPSCIPNIVPESDASQNLPWNNYQMNFQECYKLNKNVSYQAVTRQIIHEQKEIDGIKMINSTQETIVIKPISKPPEPYVKEVPVKQVVENSSNQSNGRSKISDQKINSFENSLTANLSSQIKTNQSKVVELPHSSAIQKEKPQQAVAPVVIKRVPPVNGFLNEQNHLVPNNIKPCIEKSTAVKKLEENQLNSSDLKRNSFNKVLDSNVKCSVVTPPTSKLSLAKNNSNSKKNVIEEQKPISCVKSVSSFVDNIIPIKPIKQKENNHIKQKIVQEEPKITYEIMSEDGFSFSTTDIQAAWEKVFETVQKAREVKGLPLLSQNPFPSPHCMLRKMMGLGNNSVKYILEQLPGISGCSKYKPVYHKKKLSALEQEMSRVSKENISGCARTEKVKHSQHKYDMFSWLASRHRRPPKLLTTENDSLSAMSRRSASMNLPMAMRFRHLKETSKIAVGVFRSDIHGRGLFCLRDIESGEMVIEYAGEVIRSGLTDKRERFYTAKGIGCYMFRIDDKFVVDATMKGNAARFINHSCEPNCYSRVVDILGKKHILIFALRKILQGEELTYDYKFPLEEDKINCHCLSRRCRKYLN